MYSEQAGDSSTQTESGVLATGRFQAFVPAARGVLALRGLLWHRGADGRTGSWGLKSMPEKAVGPIPAIDSQKLLFPYFSRCLGVHIRVNEIGGDAGSDQHGSWTRAEVFRGLGLLPRSSRENPNRWHPRAS